MRMLAITFRDFLGEFSTFAFFSLSLSLFCIVDDPLTVGKCPKWRIQPRHTLSSELSISGILSPAFFVSLLLFPLRYLTLLTLCDPSLPGSTFFKKCILRASPGSLTD